MLFKFISLLIKDDEAHPQESVRFLWSPHMNTVLRGSNARSCAVAGAGRGGL